MWYFLIFLIKFKDKIKKNNFYLFYFAIVLLLVEWFLNHPALRYGGFTLIGLSIFVPLSIFIEGKLNLTSKIKKKITFLIFVSFSIFLFKNIDRILKETKKYNYNPLINAHYFINNNSDHFNELFLKAEKNRNIDGKKFYIFLNKDLIKKLN